MMLPICAVIYTIPVCLLLYTLIHKSARKYYVPVKTMASIAFICLAVFCGVTGNHLGMMAQMMPAFVMCLCGDVFLGFYNGVKNKKLFLGGVATFMLGHICFIGVFVRMQRLSWIDFLFPICAIGITVLVTYAKKMFLGKLRPYVYTYSFFVAMLFSKSLHIMTEAPTAQTICLAIGATLFLISDFLILFLYFYDKRPWSTHGWNLATYYYGMFFLAVSLLY